MLLRQGPYPDFAELNSFESEARDNAEVIKTTLQAEEEVRIIVVPHLNKGSIGKDEIEGKDIVNAQADLVRDPAVATTECQSNT